MADNVISKDQEKFVDLAARARAAGFEYREVEYRPASTRRFRRAELGLPRGNGTRTVRVLEEAVSSILAIPFEKYRFSNKYNAIFHIDTGAVECALTWSPALTRGRVSEGGGIWELPGAEIDDDSPIRTGEKTDSVYGVPAGWRLRVANSEVSLELSPYSKDWVGLHGRWGPGSGVSLKVKHANGNAGPRAHELLDSFGQDFMMELELKYDLGTALATDRFAGIMSRPNLKSEGPAPAFPTLSFHSDAMDFYWYGVSAYEFPLLQYLAFYQVLEYYFAQFTRAAVANRVRTQLKNPAFDLKSEKDIGVLISTTRPAHAGLKQESEQLRLAMSECVEPNALRNFLNEDEQRLAYFTATKQKVGDVKPLRMGAADMELLDQVSERVYRVRNRIVHTKSIAEEAGFELLLPTSEEARYMGPEIELVMWLARRALVHGASFRTS